MKEDHARRVEEIYQQALDLPTEEREAYVVAECAGDETLHSEIRALLTHFEHAHGEFLEQGVVKMGEQGRKVTDPERIGPYRILHRLGGGGFGVVYEAEQSAPMRRRVALKVLKAGMDTESVLARFEAERQALALMEHPNIAKVLDAGQTEEGRSYFVMELVKGDPVTEYCDRHLLTVRQRLELFQPICRAVQHAHQKGIIHRDLKPSNIMVTMVDGQPVPKVIDFGIAKAMAAPLTERTLHTVMGQMIGTPAYMSPEQAERTGLDVDTTTDVYSLGVILYELLCGTLPFDPHELAAVGPEGIHLVLRRTEPRKPSDRMGEGEDQSFGAAVARQTEPWELAGMLGGELDWIVMRALEKDRTRRYQTALELSEEIERYLKDEPVKAGPPSTLYRMKKFARRHRVGFGIAAAIGFGIVAGAAGLTYALITARSERAQAQAARAESEEVTLFLTGMLAAMDPAREGLDVTVREVLDQASRDVDQEFADRPMLQARLHTVIGASYRELGRLDEAEEHLEKGLRIRREHLGERDYATLESRREWAELHHTAGRYEVAEKEMVEILEIVEEEFGPEHPLTISSMEDVGIIYMREERHDDSAAILEDALARGRRVLPPDDEQLKELETDLGIVYLNMGRYDDARPLFESSLQWDLAHRGPNHPSTIASSENLGALYREIGDYEKARPLYENSAFAVVDIYGPDHPSSLRYLSNLSLLYQDMGRYAQAESLALQVLAKRQELLGRDNSATLVTHLNLALLYSRWGEVDRWEKTAQEVTDLCLGSVGERHLYTLVAQGHLGHAWLAQGKALQAEALLRSARERSAEVLGERHWRTGRLMILHGQALRDLGRYEEAEKELLEAHAVVLESFGEEHHVPQAAVEVLTGLYERWGRDEERDLWASRLNP